MALSSFPRRKRPSLRSTSPPPRTAAVGDRRRYVGRRTSSRWPGRHRTVVVSFRPGGFGFLSPSPRRMVSWALLLVPYLHVCVWLIHVNSFWAELYLKETLTSANISCLMLFTFQPHWLGSIQLVVELRGFLSQMNTASCKSTKSLCAGKEPKLMDP